MSHDYLDSIRKQFDYYKKLGDQTLAQLPDEALFVCYTSESNSIAILVTHLWGNMLSRWTDFMTTDGEKEWRNRDAEFDAPCSTRETLLAQWEEGWTCLFTALDQITAADLNHIIYIRNQGHTVVEALNRQLAHYSYHVGQIVFLGKMGVTTPWNSLSIPKGNSSAYNEVKFSKPKQIGHFTDEYLKKDNKS